MRVYIERTTKRVVKITPQSDGSVRVVAFWLLGKKRIVEILRENLQWIKENAKSTTSKNVEEKGNQQSAEKPIAPTSKRQFVLTKNNMMELFALKSTLICGEFYKILPTTNNQTSIRDDSIYINERCFDDKIQRAKCIKSFLKKMCQTYLAQEISKFGCGATLCPIKIDFKDLKGKWCCCHDAERGIICLDYRVIQLPVNLQRYVIAHTFCHFSYCGHEENFWNHLSNFIPQYKDCQKQLSEFDFLFDVM